MKRRTCVGTRYQNTSIYIYLPIYTYEPCIFTNQRVMIHWYHFNDQNATEYLCVLLLLLLFYCIFIYDVMIGESTCRIAIKNRLFAFWYGLLRVYTHAIRDTFQPSSFVSVTLFIFFIRFLFCSLFVFHSVYFVCRVQRTKCRSAINLIQLYKFIIKQ